MDSAKILEEFSKFQEKDAAFDILVVLNEAGDILLTTDEGFISAEEAKELRSVWKEHKPAVVIKEDRFPVLKWDDLQFAAKNVGGKGAIVGCITKSGNFCVAHYTGGSSLIQASVDLNRWSWNVV